MANDDPTVMRARDLLRKKSTEALPDVEAISQSSLRNNAFFDGLLEAAFLVASADGDLSKEEAGSLVDIVAQVGEGITPGELAGLVYEFAAALEKDGRQARIDALAASVPDAAARREILGFASLIALCDHHLAPSELFVLHSLGKAFGLDAAGSNAVIRSVEAAMTSATPA